MLHRNISMEPTKETNQGGARAAFDDPSRIRQTGGTTILILFIQ